MLEEAAPTWADRFFDWLDRNWKLVLTCCAIGIVGLPAATGGWGKKKVFLSFAIEDKWARERVRGQSLNARTPFEFTDMGLNEPFTEKWKTQCRERIRQCDGVIALLSTNTSKADGARWEMKCAVEEGIPIIGMHVDRDNKGAIPSELKGQRVIEWSWDGLAEFIDSL